MTANILEPKIIRAILRNALFKIENSVMLSIAQGERKTNGAYLVS